MRWLKAIGYLSACAALILAVLAVGARVAAQDAAAPEDRQIDYDIPVQSLTSALSTFAATSGMQVLYETSLASGRMSTAIKGRFAPEAALRVLLEGTGLVGRRTDIDAITIAPDARERPVNTAAVAPDARFLGALQAGILRALCAANETRPGSYRLAFQIWMSPSGIIERSALLGATGAEQRDDALAKALQGVSTGAIPPYGLTQPITMVVVPREPGRHSDCDTR
ncbi:STN domain-containing protein [Microbacteriaceae bacterium K1510]|nr:STN domain-containing protein [Microbacteriaceae bacterium K1510]